MFRYFRKKKEQKEMEEVKTVEENMVYMASLGVSPEQIMQYQELSKKLEQLERKI